MYLLYPLFQAQWDRWMRSTKSPNLELFCESTSFVSFFLRSTCMKSPRTNKGTSRREDEQSLYLWICQLSVEFEKHVHQTYQIWCQSKPPAFWWYQFQKKNWQNQSDFYYKIRFVLSRLSPSCLGPLVFLLPKTFKLFGFPILWLCACADLMKVVPEMRRVH
jgi:hypothetical protein